MKFPGLSWLLGKGKAGETPAPLPSVQKMDPSDATIGTGNFTQGVPAFWFARSVEFGAGMETLTRPYALSPWVQRAIKTVALPIAGVPLLFSNPKGPGARRGSRTRCVWGARGPVRREESEFIDMPAVSEWFKEPSPGLSWSDFVEASVGWLKLQECFWVIGDEAIKPFPEAATSFPPVLIAKPMLMRPNIEEGEITDWVFTQRNGRQWTIDPDRVVRLKSWNPDDDFRGLGEYGAAHLAAESDYLAGKFSRNLMGNNGDLGGVIVAKSGVPSDAQREQIKMDLMMKRQAMARGELRYLFMTGDIDIKDPKIASVDAPFITQRLENRHEIAITFGVPPSMFDVKASYSIGSASDQYALIFNTCVPTGAKLCDALEVLIFKLTGKRVEVSLDWDAHPTMQAARREKFANVDTLANRGMPMKDISEYLDLQLPRFEGDDIGFIPINLTPIAEAKEPEPAPEKDPALGEQEQEGDKTPEPVKEMMRALAGCARPRAQERANTPEDSNIAAAGDGRTPRKEKSRRLWLAHMKKREGIARLFRSKVNRCLNEHRNKVLHKLSVMRSASSDIAAAGDVRTPTRSVVDMIFDAKAFGQELYVLVSPVMNQALQKGADDLRAEIGATDPWEFPPAKALEFIRGRKQDVQGTGAEVRSQLNTALEAGFKEGEGIDDLMDRVRGVFAGLAKGEARTIAQTETAASFSWARHEASIAAGVKYKSWLSSHGPNVRAAHEAAEDQYGDEPIPLDEPFVVDGEELMHPCDPSGSPGNVINCQCIELAVRDQ